MCETTGCQLLPHTLYETVDTLSLFMTRIFISAEKVKLFLVKSIPVSLAIHC
jgi:hypothetical protein